ncbi:MAG TPA: transglycosylase domain-containing protein [Mycobacteriales bacterium]|nr:transglycosylase domain-containing protein [Mycobacteriales bacterium]
MAAKISLRVGILLIVSVVAGVLVAGILLPFVGGVGIAARTASNDFQSLPTDLKEAPLPQVSTIRAANGEKIASFYDQDRVVVPLSAVPLVMQKALIAIEDVRFYEHGGIDVKGTLRALLANGSSGQVSQGGSTLTQQYVKNVLIEDAHTKKQRAAAIADTYSRKIREARYAIALEHKLTKNQILSRYLNIAYFGDGAYGVGTAARHFFNEPVAKLDLAQSALLAGLVQSPDAYNPRLHPATATERRDTVLAQMLKYHFIDQQQYDVAQASKVRLHIHQQPNDCTSSQYPYFCDYVKHVFEHTPGLGLGLLRRGGLTVQTTLSPKAEAAAEQGIHAYVHHKEPDKVVGAEAVVQPGTGKVRALAVSQTYGNNTKKGENTYDYAVDRRYGGSHGFQAGSTFKLFVLTAALKEGIPLSTAIKSPAILKDFPGYRTCSGESLSYSPSVSNAGDSEAGTFNLKTGTWFSVNTFFAQLEQRTGLCEPVKLAEQMGVTQGNGKAPEQVPSFVLGSGGGFTPLDLAGAYATMAAHGKYCSPIVITKITDTQGNSYPVPKAHCHQVVDPGLADTVTNILEGVLTVPGATGTIDALSGRPAAAKTGTVDNYEGSVFAGYTPQLASAVWVGVPSAPNTSLTGLTFGGRYQGEPIFGATIAGKIWQATMNAALEGDPVEEFPPPDFSIEAGTTATIPDVSGDSPSTASAILTSDGFSPVIEPGEVNSVQKAGTVASTSPGGGSSVGVGTTVEILVSNGIAPKPTPPPKKHKKDHPPSKGPNPPPITVSPKPKSTGSPKP